MRRMGGRQRLPRKDEIDKPDDSVFSASTSPIPPQAQARHQVGGVCRRMVGQDSPSGNRKDREMHVTERHLPSVVSFALQLHGTLASPVPRRSELTA